MGDKQTSRQAVKQTNRQADKQTSRQVDEGANCIWEACSYLSFCPFVRSSFCSFVRLSVCPFVVNYNPRLSSVSLVSKTPNKKKHPLKASALNIGLNQVIT